MSAVTFNWFPHKCYICINYPWGDRHSRLTDGFGTRRKAKKWARKKIADAEALIAEYGELGARVLLSAPNYRQVSKDLFVVEISIGAEIWQAAWALSWREAYERGELGKQAIAETLRDRGYDEARSILKPFVKTTPAEAV